MSVEQRCTDSPMHADPSYRAKYEQGCVAEERADGFTWYVGKGVHQSRHPIGHLFGELVCKHCQIEYATVIAAHSDPAPPSGKTQVVCEFRCDGCGKYNQLVTSD
ncbi:MAG: hypothetical protein RJA70_2416 [Pseudomonadota bacterium]|jgi:hypothetical protein